MTTLNYDRSELPVECPECGNVHMTEEQVSRDTYSEEIYCHCGVCRETYKVVITED